MPTNRFQYSNDFTLNNGNVGISSTSPQEKLDVGGVVKADNLRVVGVSSFTTYEGFLNTVQNVTENITLNTGLSGSLSNETNVAVGLTVTVGAAATVSQGYIDSLKVYNTFTVPVGGTTERPTAPRNGMLFFNRDFATIEFWDGNVWKQVDNTTRSGRGVFGGGATPTQYSTIDYINISTLGNAISFGSLSSARSRAAGCSSQIRGLFGGGETPTLQSTIDYITIASAGNGISFGSLATARGTMGACSSSTRGIWGGGRTPLNTNTIDYVQIDTLGNATSFGQLSVARQWVAGCSSPTRGIFAAGEISGGRIATIDAITISSTGNSINIGDLTVVRGNPAGNVTNGVRGIFAGGEVPAGTPPSANVIDYITIASTGKAIYFGDLTLARTAPSGTSSSTRGIFCGGYSPSPGVGTVNILEYVTITSIGNATRFGDLTQARFGAATCSDSHGGLGGY